MTLSHLRLEDLRLQAECAFDDDRVAWLTIDRPDARNALNMEVRRLLALRMAELRLGKLSHRLQNVD